MHEEIHIGKLIRKKLQEEERTVTWLAQRINYDSSNLSKKLRRKTIGCEMLFDISFALDEDFFTHYSRALTEKKKG